MNDIIYLDNNATTRVDPAVVEAMQPYFSQQYYNPSSMYEVAHTTADAISESRRSAARFLGAGNPEQLLFTSCATEANSAAILGVLKARPERRQVITTAVEHPAILEVCKDLVRSGYNVVFLPVDEHGNLSLRDYIRALGPDTALVTIMHANNESGVIFPVDELARIAKETDPGIIFHTDATQSVGKLPINLRGSFQHIDLLSFSGHKLHAPKGIGALYVRRGTPWRPFLIGGHQEGGRRAGTENVAFIVGLAKALEIAATAREEEEQIRSLRDYLESELQKRIPHVQVNGEGAPRLPNTLNIACHYIEGEGILYQLSEQGICASSGSACTSGSLEPSHVLRAMSVPFTAVHGSVRFSLSRYTTREEVDRVIEVFPKIVKNLRNLSPYWDNEKNQPRKDMASLGFVTSEPT